MPDQDLMLTPDAYLSSEAHGYFEPPGYNAVPVSPSSFSDPCSYGEAPQSPAGPPPTGAGPSPPPAHTAFEPRAWLTMPCCKCWCHGVSSPPPWTLLPPSPTPFKAPSPRYLMRSNTWDCPPSQCSPIPVQTVGRLSY